MKKALPAAIALAGSLGFAAAANAVNVNHDGLGEVLLYSYYTTEDGNDSLINITNTTDQVKAVKVRFVESMNSQEVLDFNLYLSPYDVWTAAVTKSANGAKLVTPDKSCTVPAIPASGVEFRNYQYQGSSYSSGKGGPQGTDRTRTGYLEVIEMGELQDCPSDGSAGTSCPATLSPAKWATHVNGVPALCAGITGLWTSSSSPWVQGFTSFLMSAPSGGLYGSSIIVNVEGGTDISESATALDNFAEGRILHAAPGTTAPSLVDSTDFFVLDDGTQGYADNGIDAVSAVLAKWSISNDYLTVADLNAATDWVVTMPTKRFYVNGWTPASAAEQAEGWTVSPGTSSPEPFTSFWTKTELDGVAGTACEQIDIVYFDQEERELTPSGPDFSPAPPGDAPFSLCYEANVIHINGGSVVGGGYTDSNLDLATGFDAGWININLANNWNSIENPDNGEDYYREIEAEFYDGNYYDNGYVVGLPVIGFSATQFVNGDVGGLLSNYAGSTEHKGDTYYWVD